jgi:quercetin dioxygenase-like cupin family protein
MADRQQTKHDCAEPWVGNLEEAVQFADKGIVSKTLVDCPEVKIILFCMVSGQSLSGHAAGTAATIHVLKGKAAIKLGEDDHQGVPGSFYYMPARLYHAIHADEELVFLLHLLK